MTIPILLTAVIAVTSNLGGATVTPTLLPWDVVYHGYGTITQHTPNKVTLQPATATTPDTTHAALVTHPLLTYHNTFHLTSCIHTKRQLRQNSTPNPWEVGWVLWDYLSPTQFKYFIPKPNGWEVGEVTPEGQKFLKTGTFPVFPTQKNQCFTITRTPTRTTITGHGRHVERLPKTAIPNTPTENPYPSERRVGFYAEDAEVTFRVKHYNPNPASR